LIIFAKTAVIDLRHWCAIEKKKPNALNAKAPIPKANWVLRP
jgi:hypothetical protein